MKTEKIKIQPNQDIFDIAISCYGTVAGLRLLLEDNVYIFHETGDSTEVVIRKDRADMQISGQLLYDHAVLTEWERQRLPPVATLTAISQRPADPSATDFTPPRFIYDPATLEFLGLEDFGLRPGTGIYSIYSINGIYTTPGTSAILEAVQVPPYLSNSPISIIDSGGPSYLSPGYYDIRIDMQLLLLDGTDVNYVYQIILSV